MSAIIGTVIIFRSQLYLIDHNLIFETDFDKKGFWKTHVFSHINFDQFDDRIDYQNRMMKALECWQSTWDEIPEDLSFLNCYSVLKFPKSSKDKPTYSKI